MSNPYDNELLETENVSVRNLTSADLNTVVRIDEKETGRSRKAYYEQKFKVALEESGVKISLVAEVDGMVVGFVMGQVYYGEFGMAEPTAVIDSIGVNPDFRGQKVGKALMHQLKMNLRALNVEKLETQVDWDHWNLLQFFAHEGFSPAKKICLELTLN